MQSLDTNILVRLLMRDDEAQLQKVERLLFELEANNNRVFVSSLVILETIWVLSYSYDTSRTDIIDTLLDLLDIPMIHIERSVQLKELLLSAQNSTFDLSDLMIAYCADAHDFLPVLTFDKKASKHDFFTLLG